MTESSIQIKKKYHAGARLVSLVACADKFVIRTNNQTHPFHILQHCLPKECCDDDCIVDHYPESDVWVYRLDPTSGVSIDDLKAKVRAVNDPRLVFIGSVWQDEKSQRYQLYTGNLFVQFQAYYSMLDCKSKLSEWGLLIKRVLRFGRNAFFVESDNSGELDAFDWAADLNIKDEILFCQPELVVNRRTLKPSSADSVSVDHGSLSKIQTTSLDRRWVHQRVELDDAWQHAKGRGVKICIIDDGIDADHPAFSSSGKIFAARDMLDSESVDAHHQHYSEIHGTACASVAGSADYRAYGIAPDCELIVVRTKGLGSVLEAEAIAWAVGQGADIISCSWGPSDGDIDDPADDLPSLPVPTHTLLALEKAATEGRQGRGCLVVFAAGNGREAVSLDSYASNPNVIAVGAVNREDQLTRYSDRGNPLFCVFPSSELSKTEQGYTTQYGVTVADRVGIDGYSDGDYFSLFGGTSAAAPGVAGVAALVLQLRPELDLAELKAVLAASCEKVGSLSAYSTAGVSENYGYGLLNAKYAVHNALSFRLNNQLNVTDFGVELTDPQVDVETRKLNGDIVMEKNQTNLAQGYALHIGVDIADPQIYDSFTPLTGCVNDAKALAKLTQEMGFNVRVLHNQQATMGAIKAQMTNLARTAKAGDLVLMSYAGHGSYVDDLTENTNKDEPIDEVLVSYDGLLIDDEINSIIKQFRKGVRVVWIADCCHASSNLRGAKISLQRSGIARNSREIPLTAANRVLQAQRSYYQGIQRSVDRNSRSSTQASVLGLYACTETQQAQEFDGRGAFTQRIEQVIKRFSGDYQFDDLLKAITEPLSGSQHPEIELIGKSFTNFSNGVFRISGARVIVNSKIGGNVIDNFSGANATSPSPVNLDYPAEQSTMSSFIVVEKAGTQELSIANGRSRSSTSARIIDGELQTTASLNESPWDAAYNLLNRLQSTQGVEFIEPDVVSDIFQPPEILSSGARSNSYLPTYPNPEDEKYHDLLSKPFIWHLEDRYSQLQSAFDSIARELPEKLTQEQIDDLPLICHIDTGVLSDHPSLPMFFDPEKSRSFTRLGNKKDVTDVDKRVALVENQGHGHGTVSILAGNYVSFDQTDKQYKGYSGAFPYARVMSVKISEHVVLLSGNKFAKAIRHAIKEGAQVVTMSMAGAPTRTMLKAINEAYDAGVVVVSAAGNSWVKGARRILPKHTMYPARFNRVIGVTGATLDKTPYLVEENSNWQSRDVGGATMQTCYGPKEASRTNLAAYTPNVQWAGDFDGELFNRSGGGTSSATPQVAAAAAMYMYVHRKELANHEPAMRAEITRQALFQSAEKTSNPEFNQVFGNGMLKAFDALKLKPSELAVGLKPEKSDSLGWFISDNIFKQLFNLGGRSLGSNNSSANAPANAAELENHRHHLLSQMLRTEMAQLCHLDEHLVDVDQDTPIEMIADRIQQSDKASNFLKQRLMRAIPIKVPLSMRAGYSQSNREVYSSHVLQGLGGAPVLVEARGCGLSVREMPNSSHKDNSIEAMYELGGVAVNARSTISPSMTISAPLNSKSGAVLITEQDLSSGEQTFRWLMPDQSTRSLSSIERTESSMTFSMSGAISSSGTELERGETRGLVGAVKKIVVTLYRTATDQALSDQKGLIVGKIENGKFAWLDRDKQIDAAVCQQRNTLMLIHGTFSSAESAFDGLLSDQRFLQDCQNQKIGSYVLAYNMSTITSSVSDNASSLKRELTKLGLKDRHRKLSVVAHSRGCLVARQAFDPRTKMALISGTHLGTPLADGENLGALLNRVSNLAAITFAGTPAFSLFLKGLSKIVQFIGEADGLENQAPDNEFLTKLNKSKNLTEAQLLIGANFEPTAQVLRKLDDVALDIIIFGRNDNDGVTPTDSALALGYADQAITQQAVDRDLHHLNMFYSDKIKSAILHHFLQG